MAVALKRKYFGPSTQTGIDAALALCNWVADAANNVTDVKQIVELNSGALVLFYV